MKTNFSDLGQPRRNQLGIGGVLECLSPDLSAYLVRFQKNQFQKSLVFSEGARVVSVKNSDLGQIAKNLENVGVGLDCVGPDLSVYEVGIQKKSKP